jgi:phosphomethylpyrimidine synthase
MTQLELARAGNITPEMEVVAAKEKQHVETIRQRLAAGTVVIPRNQNRSTLSPIGIGYGLATKVSASIGTLKGFVDVEEEKAKVQAAIGAGTDAIMDLSSGGSSELIDEMRRSTIKATDKPLGTLPIYQAVNEAIAKHGAIVKLTVDELFQVIERQAEDGVDFMGLHCSLNWDSLKRLERHGRVEYIVSYGGNFLTAWMLYNQQENPLFEFYDRLLEIAHRHDVCLSLADTFRPGCLTDSLDRSHVQELIILGELVDRARAAGVQIMIKGPGHTPVDQIQATVQLMKQMCTGAPYFVFGPIATDIAPGYDHITAAIGGALAAQAGADFLCYVTPAEHITFPTVEHVREGVYAARIAAHAADLVKQIPGAWDWDLSMSKARKALDWEGQVNLALNPAKAQQVRAERSPNTSDVCTMCGDYCAMKVVSEHLGTKQESC